MIKGKWCINTSNNSFRSRAPETMAEILLCATSAENARWYTRNVFTKSRESASTSRGANTELRRFHLKWVLNKKKNIHVGEKGGEFAMSGVRCAGLRSQCEALYVSVYPISLHPTLNMDILKYGYESQGLMRDYSPLSTLCTLIGCLLSASPLSASSYIDVNFLS